MALPSRKAPAAPAAPAPVDTSVAASGSLGRNVNYGIEGEGDNLTLVLLINISDAAVRDAPKSEKGNPVMSTSAGFKYLDGLLPNGQQIGVSLNIIAKAPR